MFFSLSLYNNGMNAKNPIDIAAKFLDNTKSALSSVRIPPEFANAVDAVLNCKGKIITTGMGKAGYAAQKVASSFSSLTFPALYLDPAAASHGDVGVIHSSDILITFSTSGKTREVLEVVQFAKILNVSKIISITSHSDSPVRPISDIVLDMGSVNEAGYLGIAPTTSILVMLLLADMLVLTASEIKGISMQDYGLRHHGGYLGKKCRGEER